MKTILLTIILCFAQQAFGQEVYSAKIEHEVYLKNSFVFRCIITTPLEYLNLLDTSIEFRITDPKTNASVKATNISLTTREFTSFDCDSTASFWTHEYLVGVDVTGSRYDSLISSCTLRGELFIKNRAGGKTLTNGTGKTIYVYNEFNVCDSALTNRNSIRSEEPGVFYSCRRQANYFGLYASDIEDFDSLSYELTNPMIDRQTTTTYKTGYSAKQPIDIESFTQFKFDSTTGQFSFMPYDTADNRASVSIKTTEWRKNSSGDYVEIGSNLREILLFVKECDGNMIPVVKGPYQTEVCEGQQICFTISTFDKIKTRPPPWPKPEPDTVSLRWNRGIRFATFTILDPKERLQTARFCWTPEVGKASKLPYTFTATARDNFCPNNGISTRAFSVYVTSKPEGYLKIRPVSDSSFSVKINIPTAQDANNYITKISLEDLDGNPITDRNEGYFKRSNNDSTKYLADTLIMGKSVKFRLTTTISAKSNSNCSAVFHDTLNFHTSSVLNRDTRKLNIFPNPTDGHIRFLKTVHSVQVRNSLGQLVWEQDKTQSIDLTQYPAGIYTVSGIFENRNYSGKVVKY
jgi:hypothetical protein